MIKNIIVIFTIIFLPFLTFSQQSISQKLKEIEGITIIQKEHKDFVEYFEIMVVQPIDHFNITGKFYQQRIFIGFNNIAAPTVLEIEGYAISYSSLPKFIAGSNYILVEHRYFGKSLLDTFDWTFLTIKQASSDLHRIRELFSQIFVGKWLTTGVSKGGQTAIAYKMFFPNDADATLVYVTPIKNGPDDKRLWDFIKLISKTECGKKVHNFQLFAFRNKAELLKEFNEYVQAEGYTFGKMTIETVFEYILLEYPFSFYQNCFDCNLIPDTTATTTKILDEIISVVSPRFFSDFFRKKLEPSFYMFYHELGYYEYDLAPFKQWLSSSSYPNSIFAPQNVTINFDTTYLSSLNNFINDTRTEKIIFVYGELDPYTSTRPSLENNKNCQIVIVKNGCHRSRLANLTIEQQHNIFKQLSTWLQWTVGN